MSDYECDHQEIYDDICQDCGHVMESIADLDKYTVDVDGECYASLPKKREKFSYLTELSQLEDLDREVVAIVKEKISEMEIKPHMRLITHRKNLFTFIYMAYNSLEKPFDPAKIGLSLGLKDKQIRLAVREMSTRTKKKDSKDTLDEPDDEDDGRSSPDSVIKPTNPIRIIPPEYYFKGLAKSCKKIHDFLPHQIENMTALSNQIFAANPMMYNERPSGIAATIMKMFLAHHKLLTPEFFSKEVTNMGTGYIKGVEILIIESLNSISDETNLSNA
jgi:hypothetical protein